MGYTVFTIALALGYLLLQGYYTYHWRKTISFKIPDEFTPGDGITVVLIARNEEEYIIPCIKSISSQHYPEHLLEIIVVNDRSTDQTPLLIESLAKSRLWLLNLSDFPEYIHPPAFKKSAIELAVHHASYEVVVVTDADCIHDPEWLRHISYAFEKTGAMMLTGPVLLNESKTFIEKLQEMENLAFMMVTAGGITSGLHYIANGGNMAFSKKAFTDIGGYRDNYLYASGDDMFLIEKMKERFPGQIIFLKSKDAIAYTYGKENWTSLIRQRVRWAGKNNALKSPVINRIWGFIGFYHMMLLITFLMPWFGYATFLPFGILLISKCIADFILIREASIYFKKESILKSFFPLQAGYMVYILLLGWNLLKGTKSDW